MNSKKARIFFCFFRKMFEGLYLLLCIFPDFGLSRKNLPDDFNIAFIILFLFQPLLYNKKRITDVSAFLERDQTNKQANKQTNKQTNKPTHKQRNKETAKSGPVTNNKNISIDGSK